MKLMNHTILLPIACMLTGMSLFLVVGLFSVPPFLQNKIAFGILATVIIFTVCALFLKLDKKALLRYHLMPDRRTWVKLIQGFFIGAVIIGSMLLLVFSLTDLSVTQTNSEVLASFLIASIAFIPFALMEELLFRGYPLFKLAGALNTRWAILITSIGFALYHYNGTSTLSSLFLGPGVWGVVFCIAAIQSNSIALPLGIHISANFLQAIVGLKPDYLSIWHSSVVSGSSSIGLPIESLGLALQLLLLVCAILVFEVILRRRQENNHA